MNLFGLIVKTLLLAAIAVFSDSSVQAETIRSQSPDILRIARNQPFRQPANSASLPINATARLNFNIATSFVIALADAANLNSDAGARDAVIVDLVTLIDHLGEEPEADTLASTLRGVLKKQLSQDRVAAEIAAASESYVKRRAPVDRWYFETGFAVTGVILDTYRGDAAAVRANLLDLKRLRGSSPNGLPPEVLVLLDTLFGFEQNENLTEQNFPEIFKAAMGILVLFNE